MDDVIARILLDEGGAADLKDGKGHTFYGGQTKQWLDDNGFVPPSNAADAAANYATWFTRTGIAKIIARDGFIGWLVADACVNFGLSAGVKVLQRALAIKDDGVIGPQTVAAIPAGNLIFARRLVAAKGRYYGDILASEQIDRRKFARGWMHRLGRQIEALP